MFVTSGRGNACSNLSIELEIITCLVRQNSYVCVSFARNISTRVLINITIAVAALIKNPFRSCSITVGVHTRFL
jgi:hypothetical protein